MIRRPHALELTIYTRRDCCLCDDMKQTLRNVMGTDLAIQEIDVDQSVELQTRFGAEVPVLFINGRKTFKYRVTDRELRAKLEKLVKNSFYSAAK